MEREGYWVSVHPLFLYGNKGLYPVFKTGGPTGNFPKNHQEFILKEIGERNEEINISDKKRESNDILNRI